MTRYNLFFILVLLGLILGSVALSSCVSQDVAAARRANAEANLVNAQADAYSRRIQADVSASAEREAQRQASIDAAHQRRIDSLPMTLTMAAGGTACLVVLLFAVYAIMLRHQQHEQNTELLKVLLALQSQNDRLNAGYTTMPIITRHGELVEVDMERGVVRYE